MKAVSINSRLVGDGQPAYIIAEAGCNHNQDFGLAMKLVDMARAARADCVKFQSYHAENMYSRKTPMIEHFKERLGLGADATMFDLIKMTELPWEMHTPLVDYCRQQAVVFLSTPFEEEAVDLLETFDAPAYKVASFEMTHYPLLRRVGQTGKPLILSTGMSTLGDIEKALNAFVAGGGEEFILLHCVSNYPADPENCNLRNIDTMKAAFDCPVGLSDHTPGIEVAKVAIARGANIIEKHITVDQSLPGPDHFFSLTPDELTALVQARDDIEKMLGSARKVCLDAEQSMKEIARRSLVAACAIPAGTVIAPEMVAVKRPGSGLHPELTGLVVGSVAQRDIEEDDPLRWDMLLPRREQLSAR